MISSISLAGNWACEIPGRRDTVALPGTLEEAGIGFPDDPAIQWKVEEVRRIGFYRDGDPIVTRLTRSCVFEGCARLTRTLTWQPTPGARVFVDAERARHLRLMVNGREAPTAEPGCLSAPWCFEVTGLVTGRDEFTFLSDNSYPGWPRDAIVYSSAASDETQTNWNGLTGFLRLREERPVFLSSLRIYPRRDTLTVIAELDASVPFSGVLHVDSDALAAPAERAVSCGKGRTEIRFEACSLRPDCARWDLGEGVLHTLIVSADGLDARTESFGIRDFEAQNGALALNGRRIFLRGEANCAVFPETGYCPTDPDAWKMILEKYRAYGVNCLRFHSHCPPEAAFTAADELGLLMQPELSHWDPEHAFASPESRAYYETELIRILRRLANHPSFVMLTFGNELHADEDGHRFMDHLLSAARALDPTRLYANGSNPHYGHLGSDPSSDFLTAAAWRSRKLRACGAGPSGWLNDPEADEDIAYDDVAAAIRQETDQPIFSFEVGQYEILPDFGQLSGWRGITRPENLEHIRRKVREKGLEKDWKKRVEATGELSLLCYRAEVEAAMRTAAFSGISLLGIQDFPGQGTALVGMMDSRLEPKPYPFASPERFAAFFRDTLPLACLPHRTRFAGRELCVPIKIAHYGKDPLAGDLRWSLTGTTVRREGVLPGLSVPCGCLTDAGCLHLPPEAVTRPEQLTLTLSFAGIENEYALWIYPETEPVCPPGVHEGRTLDEEALAVLEAGGRVFLAPDSTEEAIPSSVQAHFSPDFWSVCTFPEQSGSMGQLIDAGHPLFESFPTSFHSDWQWRTIACSRAFLLPENVKTIVAELDSYAFLRPLAKIFECRCGRGKLLACSLGLHRLQQHPEARALLQAVYDYLASDRFEPEQTLSPEWIRSLFR